MKWNFTGGTPARITLNIIATSFLGYAVMTWFNANNTFDLLQGALLFVGGSFLYVLREHVSNGDYFKEFDNHLHQHYDVLTTEEMEKEMKEQEEEQTGYIA